MNLTHRSFKGASRELHRQYQKGASDPSKEERGFGASSASGSFHCHRRSAYLPRLPLRVPWRLVGAYTPEVRQINPSLQTQNMHYFQNLCINFLFNLHNNICMLFQVKPKLHIISQFVLWKLIFIPPFLISKSCRIKDEPSAVVCPVIDVIDWNTFQYLGNPGEPQIGGFDWRLVFTWHTIPEYEQKRRSSATDVIRSVLHGCT